MKKVFLSGFLACYCAGSFAQGLRFFAMNSGRSLIFTDTTDDNSEGHRAVIHIITQLETGKKRFLY